MQMPMYRKEAPNVLMAREHLLPAFYTLPGLRALPGKNAWGSERI